MRGARHCRSAEAAGQPVSSVFWAHSGGGGYGVGFPRNNFLCASLEIQKGREEGNEGGEGKGTSIQGLLHGL
jgi:hypothetical protein